MNKEGATPNTDNSIQTSDAVIDNAEVKNQLTEIDTLVKSLKASLADKATEVEELHSVASEQEKKFSEEKALLSSRVTELETALSEATKAKEIAETELKTMKEEALLNQRLEELASKGLLMKTDEKKVKQAERVKNMTAEQFAEYITELSDICQQAVGNSAKATDTAIIAEEVAEKVKNADPEMVQKVLNNMNKAEVKTDEPAKEKASTTEPKKLDSLNLVNALTLIAKRKNT